MQTASTTLPATRDQARLQAPYPAEAMARATAVLTANDARSATNLRSWRNSRCRQADGAAETPAISSDRARTRIGPAAAGAPSACASHGARQRHQRTERRARQHRHAGHDGGDAVDLRLVAGAHDGDADAQLADADHDVQHDQRRREHAELLGDDQPGEGDAHHQLADAADDGVGGAPGQPPAHLGPQGPRSTACPEGRGGGVALPVHHQVRSRGSFQRRLPTSLRARWAAPLDEQRREPLRAAGAERLPQPQAVPLRAAGGRRGSPRRRRRRGRPRRRRRGGRGRRPGSPARAPGRARARPTARRYRGPTGRPRTRAKYESKAALRWRRSTRGSA